MKHQSVELLNVEEEVQVCEWTPTYDIKLSDIGVSTCPKDIQNEELAKTNIKRNWKKHVTRAIRLTALLMIISGIISFFGVFLLSDSFEDYTISVFNWIRSLPTWLSASVMILLYAVSLLFFCPGTPFNMAAGFLYGIFLGCTVALIGCILGSIIAFILGRTIVRDWVKNKMESKPKFKAVDWALRKNGLYIVFLTRLSPLFPFPLLNYAFGATHIKAWQYVLGTSMGVAPGTIGYAYLGTLMRNIAEMWTSVDDEDSDLIWWIIGGGLTLLSIIAISIITQRAISSATKEYEKLHDENSPDLEIGSKNLELKNLLQEKEEPHKESHEEPIS